MSPAASTAWRTFEKQIVVRVLSPRRRHFRESFSVLPRRASQASYGRTHRPPGNGCYRRGPAAGHPVTPRKTVTATRSLRCKLDMHEQHRKRTGRPRREARHRYTEPDGQRPDPRRFIKSRRFVTVLPGFGAEALCGLPDTTAASSSPWLPLINRRNVLALQRSPDLEK